MNRLLFLFSAALCFLFSSCVKDAEIKPEQPSQPVVPTDTALPSVVFRFNAMNYSKNMTHSNQECTNSSQDYFTIEKLNYFVSNIKLISENGSVYSVPENYHLIKHLEGKTSFTLTDIPEGNYKGIEFLIGVDSVRNTSGAQTGDLDPRNDMYWDWEQGYIFFKIEGVYTTQTKTQPDFFSIHIGGFEGPNKCLQTASFVLNTPLITKKGKASTVFYNTHTEEIFMSPHKMGLDDYYDNPITDATFKKISENYKDMFSIERIEN